jgi:hypothetical protein
MPRSPRKTPARGGETVHRREARLRHVRVITARRWAPGATPLPPDPERRRAPAAYRLPQRQLGQRTGRSPSIIWKRSGPVASTAIRSSSRHRGHLDLHVRDEAGHGISVPASASSMATRPAISAAHQAPFESSPHQTRGRAAELPAQPRDAFQPSNRRRSSSSTSGASSGSGK